MSSRNYFSRRGVAAAEFLVCMPVFVMLLMGIIEFWRLQRAEAGVCSVLGHVAVANEDIGKEILGVLDGELFTFSQAPPSAVKEGMAKDRAESWTGDSDTDTSAFKANLDAQQGMNQSADGGNDGGFDIKEVMLHLTGSHVWEVSYDYAPATSLGKSLFGDVVKLRRKAVATNFCFSMSDFVDGMKTLKNTLFGSNGAAGGDGNKAFAHLAE